MAKSKKRKVSLADQVRLGERVAALKATTDPKEWAAIVKGAHARGFTVAGATSGVPDALKERTKSSLIEEANKTVGSAFKPAEQALDHQEAKAKALSIKRAADENHFQEWLASQNDSMATRALTADAEMARRQSEIQTQTQQGYAQAQAGAQATAGATAGNVSDPGQSTALNLAPEAQRANDQVAAQRQQSASMSNNAAGYALAAKGVSIGLGQQATSKRISDENSQLAEVAKDRAGLMDKRASVAAEEISRLFGVEMQKADSNRNYLAAADKLNIASAGLQLDADKAEADISLRDRKLKQDATIADARLENDRYKITNANRQKQLDRELREKLKAANPADKTTSAEIKQSNNMASKLSKIASDISALRAGKKTKRPLRQVITGRGASSIEYELALDLAVNGKLSAVNRRRAAQLGILNPGDL